MRYETFIKRNTGYISEQLQEKIRSTRVLIAGCGIGSTVAEAMLRLGFLKLSLIDGDIVEPHNLNRQDFTNNDIGHHKVEGLANRLRSIYPEAELRTSHDWVTPENAADVVNGADIIFDTIDFLSLESIVAVHDEDGRQGKPVVSAVSAGWGAAAFHFPPHHSTSFRSIFKLPATGSVKGYSYTRHFSEFVEKMGVHLGSDIRRAMAKALTVMEDGTPCPAPHLSVGSYCVAALGAAIVVRLLSGQPVAAAPELILVNLADLCAEGISIR